ncbi:MAG: ABC transporter permease [Muribaculaceae bacterium]|nr:ABC transporter permease [Muribaculaceae bacterium]
MTPIAKHLLSININRARLVAFGIANLIGLTIVMLAIHFYGDIKKTLYVDINDAGDYIVISKKIDTFGQTDAPGFSVEMIDSIIAQPWVLDAGPFQSSQADIMATVLLPDARLSTSLFFEAVPDRFLDIHPAAFTFEKGDLTVPVILPKEYLSLYNFGYASARNLPAMSEAMLGMVPLQITVSGNGNSLTFKGMVVGFSSRINTIAVPQNFITTTNQMIGSEKSSDPSRLIVKIDPTNRHLIAPFLEKHNLDTTSSDLQSQTDYILRIITVAVVIVGLIICVLSLFLLTLTIFLTLEKNRDKTRSLLQLGYSPRSIAAYYRNIIILLNSIVFLIATSILILIDCLVLHHANEYISIQQSSIVIPMAVGFALTLISVIINILSVKRSI